MVKLLNIESLISKKKSSPNQFQNYRLRRILKVNITLCGDALLLDEMALVFPLRFHCRPHRRILRNSAVNASTL